MPDQAPNIDPREIWLSQPTEPIEMKPGSHRFRQKAKNMQSKSRREMLNSLVVAVLIAAGSIYGSIWIDFPAARVSFAVAAAWILIGQVLLHRAKRQAPPPEDAGLRTSLDSCRRELERQIQFDRGVHLWLGGPLILAFGTFLGAFVFAVGGSGMLVKMTAPALALLVAWALAMVVFRQSQEREFRRAIEDLERIAREQ
jgi:hypothetical protein